MGMYRLALYAGIALITIGGVLFIFDTPRGILGSVDLETERDLEAFAIATSASTHYYDKDGQLAYTFRSAKLRHFRPESGDFGGLESQYYTAADQPDIEVFDEVAPWHMSAKSARVDANQIITLSDQVVLERIDPNDELTVLSTSELVFDANNKLAYTSKAVTITSPLGLITATGMQADMATKNIKLLSKVKGRHLPQTLSR